MNLSFEFGVFPDRLKIVRITPIFKGAAKFDRRNYRPISVLPVVSKIHGVVSTPESSVFFDTDDTETHHSSPTLETAVLKINSNHLSISAWLWNNNLILNTEKTEAMIVAK